MKRLIELIIVLNVALVCSVYSVNLAIQERNRSFAAERLLDAFRGEYEGMRRTLGHGVDNSFICKSK